MLNAKIIHLSSRAFKLYIQGGRDAHPTKVGFFFDRLFKCRNSLATHAFLNELKESEVPGAIAQAASQTDDGLLTSNEILDWRLQAELVVLSACNTGRAIITGDGVIGLSASLMTAGVASVVLSLWSVPDAPTCLLMMEFDRQMQANPDKAQALGQAMLTVMKEYLNRSNRAAFTLMGKCE